MLAMFYFVDPGRICGNTATVCTTGHWTILLFAVCTTGHGTVSLIAVRTTGHRTVLLIAVCTTGEGTFKKNCSPYNRTWDISVDC